MRLIDADALHKKVKTECNPYGKPTINFEDGCKVLNMIDTAPTIEERNTGEWIYGEDDVGQDGWTCSKCGFFVPWYYDYYGLNNIDFIRDFHTCPHCDAKMLTYTGKEDGGGA